MPQSKPIALVTGTSTGFGNLIARDVNAAGYRTFATMRDTASRNARAKAELEALGIAVLEVDVTSDASVDAAARAVEAAGPVDVLVNNAGAAFLGLSEAFTSEAVLRQLDVNVVSTVRINRAFLPAMRRAGRGLVVYVSSVVGRIVIPFTGVYTASKFALEALAETAAYELRPSGIDVAIVEPGAFNTNISSAIVGPDDAARVASYGALASGIEQVGQALAATAGDPQNVSDAILALVKLPAGERPLRTVVGGDDATLGINASIAPLQRAVLEGFGFGALAARQPVTA